MAELFHSNCLYSPSASAEQPPSNSSETVTDICNRPGLGKLQDESVDPRVETVMSTATVSPVCHCHRGGVSAAILVLSAVERLLICILLHILFLPNPERKRIN